MYFRDQHDDNAKGNCTRNRLHEQNLYIFYTSKTFFSPFWVFFEPSPIFSLPSGDETRRCSAAFLLVFLILVSLHAVLLFFFGLIQYKLNSQPSRVLRFWSLLFILHISLLCFNVMSVNDCTVCDCNHSFSNLGEGSDYH